METDADKALLPPGLGDILPPDAALEAAVVERLLATFAAHGYERVKPPLVEFEESLLAGAGADMAGQTFRLMDPVSHRMLAVRADMTPQVARIAATRLASAPRPLRLSYAGQVLQVKGSQLRPERQFGQVGAELIGATGAEADAEVVLVAAEALREAGVEHLTVDLNLPTLIAALVQGLGLDSELLPRLRSALDRKDEAAVATLALRGAEIIVRLMRSAGPADRSLPMLLALDLPDGAQEERQRLSEVVALVRAAAPDLILTIDPVEHRGFEYHTGVSFTVFARGVRGELGRGGRYDIGKGESSTGFTLYTDSLMRALPATDRRRRLYVPLGASATTAAALRREGWVTVAGLAAVADPTAEARRLGCSHVLLGDGVEAVDPRR